MNIPEPVESPAWSTDMKRIVGVIAFVAAMLLILQFAVILPLVFTAVVLSYLFHPVADSIQEGILRGKLRPLAVVLTFLLVIAIMMAALLFVIPPLSDQVQSLIAGAPAFLQDVQDGIIELLETEFDLRGTPLERLYPEPVIISEAMGIDTGEDGVLETFDVLQSQLANFDVIGITQQLAGSLTQVTGSAFSFLGGAVSIGLNMIFLLTMTFYLMTDGENMINALVRATPDGYQDDTRRMLSELGEVWNSYLRGQVILSLIMGTAMYLMATVLGIPNALFLAIFAGLMEFIPNIGPALAMVPAALIALFTTSTTIEPLSGFAFALVVVLVWTVLQQTEAVVLIPRIVGDSLNLHPFVVLVAVLGGISVGGIFAVLIAAPVVASGRLIAQYVYGKLTDREPFPVNRKTARQMRRERRPVLVRFGDYCARWVRGLLSSRAITKRGN
ncbi:MAG: AI-2E family transporter [Chloroflexota bacterium]